MTPRRIEVVAISTGAVVHWMPVATTPANVDRAVVGLLEHVDRGRFLVRVVEVSS